ncbi:MAG: VWA domain-containing protein [Rubricoccaceae bacterium]|nr:VWA domain-containing protein [Rubricoccaceae bacterium]
MRFRYSEFDPERHGQARSTFDTLFDLFQQLLFHTGGDADEALRWLTQIDEQYGLTDEGMGLGDFIEELKDRGYIERDDETGVVQVTAKTVRGLRERSLEEIFSQLRKGGRGDHRTPFSGAGSERQPETRPYSFGDDVHDLDVTGTLSNAVRRGGLGGPEGSFSLHEDDFQVFETDHHTSVATVLMIDLSHSMVLYGEDRITPARKTALALAELITTRYPKDTLDIVAFGNDAWEVQLKDLPFLQVGPFHTNTRAGLVRARDLLRRRKNRNKQIFLITDGKPSCHFEGGRLYRNAYGLDRRIVNKVLDEAAICRRERITITTFMIARDPYLQAFVRQLTEVNQGRAYYAGLDELGGFLFEDYVRNRRKTTR